MTAFCASGALFYPFMLRIYENIVTATAQRGMIHDQLSYDYCVGYLPLFIELKVTSLSKIQTLVINMLKKQKYVGHFVL